MPTTLTYEITTNDFLEFQKAIMKNVRNEATGITKSSGNFLLFVILVLAIGGLVILGPMYFPLDMMSVVAGIVAVILLLTPMTIHFQRRMVQMSLPRKDGAVIGLKTMEIDDDTFTVLSYGLSTRIAWRAVLEVIETKNLYILRLDTLLGQMVPKRALETCNDPERVRALIQNSGGK